MTLCPQGPSPVESGHAACPGPFSYELGEENVCVLDFARFKLDEGPWSERREILQVDRLSARP